MKTHSLTRCIVGSLLLFCAGAQAQLSKDAVAPAFSLKATDGKTHTLADAKGKWVVLEWLNHGCPFVKKHYEAGKMQALQSKYTGTGKVVWYSIVSGKGEATADAAFKKPAATAVLLDPSGETGHAYGATNTPQMFIINPEGKVAYQGAIDDKRTTELADVATAHNYVETALDSVLKGGKIAEASHKVYGCTIKY
ncbi:redoxin domain-containing protein [bacterium]|nr:redoxin domain-containing protein [bacterium]